MGDVVAAFNAELASIYESKPPISKNKIVEITKAALKAIKFYKHVVFSVEKFLGKCKAEYKIPCLYVMDSILRQSKRQFKEKDVFSARFAKNFENTLLVLLQCSPSDRMKIARTINLWEANGVFTPEKIAQYREICVANGVDMDRDAVEKAVKGENADLTIYDRSGEKEKRERQSHHHTHKEHRDHPENTPRTSSMIAKPSEEIPPGGISEATLLSILQLHMVDMGQTAERDVTLLKQMHAMIVEKIREKVEMERNANKQVSVKKLLSSGFDYSDEEDNDEEKEEAKPPPPPTQEELDKLAVGVCLEREVDIRSMHGERLVKLQNAALDAKRAEAQKAAQEVMAQQEKDAVVAQAQKMAAQQQAAAAAAVSSQSSILGNPPPGPPFGLPPGMQLGGLGGIPGLPQVSLSGPGGLNSLLQQGNLDPQFLNSLNLNILSNPLGLLGQGPNPQLGGLQNNPLLRLNPQFAALAAGGPDLQALLSQPPPALPPGMGLSQQQLSQMAGVGGGLGLGGSLPPPTSGPPPGPPPGMMGVPPPHHGIPNFSPSKKPPSLMDIEQTDIYAQMMMQAPPSNEEGEENNHMEMERRESRDEEEKERDERGGDRDRRKSSRDDRRSDRRDRDRGDKDRERSEHRGRDHKEKKRKRSRSREGRRERSKDRSERDDKERRKMGLPSHHKDSTTTIASCTVWLGRLPQMNEDDLRYNIIELAGASQVQLMPTRACAYVTMKDRRSAVKLLEKTKGLKVKGKEIKSSWAAGNGTKSEKWRSYWDEDRGISSIPHGELPLDAMNHLCDGGWLDVSTLPIHLRGIIDENGKVIDQSTSSTSILDEAVTSHSSHSFDLGQVQLPPAPDLSSIPNPMGHFQPNLGLGGAGLMMPHGMPPMGGHQFGLGGMGMPNGLAQFMPSPMRGRGGGPPPGAFIPHHMNSPMGRGGGRGDWRGGGGGGRGGAGFMPRGGGRGGWNGGAPPPSMDRLGGGFDGRRSNTRWGNDDATVSSTTMNDDHDKPRGMEDPALTKIDNMSDDMEME